jgi:hypothetical protein
MKKYILTVGLSLFYNFIFGQEIKSIENYKGVWIAEDFYNSFHLTKSMIASKKSFHPNHPVGFTINPISNNQFKIVITYSTLHDHNLYRESVAFRKSDYTPPKNFILNLNNRTVKDTVDIPNILNDLEDSNCMFYMTFDSIITFYQKKENDCAEIIIKYKKVLEEFDKNNPHPNPIYDFIRREVLSGEYFLTNEKDSVLSKNLTINNNGIINGYEIFENKKIGLNSDVYCGLEMLDDMVYICNNDLQENFDCVNFYFIKSGNNIYLFDFKDHNIDGADVVLLGELKYKLIPKITAPFYIKRQKK